ncbi:MAG: porin [Rhodoferax sp.]|uniref:porin n=1 Tax=Rhodoferax sp. TaxID=50421 RepID=UPI003BB508DB
MNFRNLLVGALGAAAVVAAHAQSSVTLYGLLDIAPAVFSRSAAADERMVKLNSDTGSSSRFGMRGTEDLGGGLSAVFNLEAPIDPKNGAVSGGASSGSCNAAAGCATETAFWRRNAFVGLKGSFGEVTLGRNYTGAIIKQADTLSATPSGINTGLASTLLSQGLSNDFWNSNQIRYDSPRLGPIDFSVHTAAGEGGLGESVGGNVRFLQGPVAVSLSVQKDENLAGGNVTWTMLSGSYDFGKFKLHAGADTVDNSDGVLGFVDSTLWTVGASFKATNALTLAAQYWSVKEKVGAATTSKLLVLNADYKLSKRSALYVMFGSVDNKDLAISPLWGNQNFSGAGNVRVANDKNNGLAMGIRHSF